MFKAHRLVYHSTLGSREKKKRSKRFGVSVSGKATPARPPPRDTGRHQPHLLLTRLHLAVRVWGLARCSQAKHMGPSTMRTLLE